MKLGWVTPYDPSKLLMKKKLQINNCPTCGSDKIQRVIRDLTRNYKGQNYTAPSVELYECSICGEKVYDRDAMLKIEDHSPAYQTTCRD